MPLSVGVSVHDDSAHTGNAKRETINGLAGLDAGGEVIARLNYEGAAGGVATLDANAEFEDVDVMTQKYLSIAMVM